MHKLVEEYLTKKANEKANAELEKKNKLLIDLGLFEKEYSDHYSPEFPYIESTDSGTAKYFRRTPVEVSDSEYEEILKYQKDINNVNNTVKAVEKNKIATVFKVLAWIIFIVGFIVGIILGAIASLFTVTLTCWVTCFVSGMVFLGFAEIIQLLTAIKNK